MNELLDLIDIKINHKKTVVIFVNKLYINDFRYKWKPMIIEYFIDFFLFIKTLYTNFSNFFFDLYNYINCNPILSI